LPVVEDLFGPFEWRKAACGLAGSRRDLPQQVANGVDVFYRFFVQLRAGLLADLLAWLRGTPFAAPVVPDV
jgi:hypothetical protein